MQQHMNLINGEWVATENVIKNISPADTSDVIGEYCYGDASSVDDAVAAAQAALPSWAATSPQVRHDLLEAVGRRIESDADDIAKLMAREEGKTVAEAKGETLRASQIFKFFAGETLREGGELQRSVRPGIEVEITREPVGVIGLITPWNFPIAIPAWKAAPAIAFGNCVVLKPADLTPGCANVLAAILNECGCPPGVFNLVMGRGSVVGEAIINHPAIDAISFTGSVKVGSRIAELSGADKRKTQLEMGGKNPMLVMNDADLTTAVDACLNGAFFSTGQRCTASSRILVQEGIYDQFVDALTKAMAELRVGNPLDPNTQIGPVVDEKQLASNLQYVNLAAKEAEEVVGGERLNFETEGYFQAPALFIGTNNSMRISREEIFGPCASIIKVADLEEGITIANDTEFGLSSGICTSNLRSAHEFRRRSQAGMVMVNLPTAGVDYHVPFGGRKGSSFGPREQGQYAAEFYTVVKTSYVFAG